MGADLSSGGEGIWLLIKDQSEAEEFIFWGDVVIFGEIITKGKIKGANDFHFNAVIELLGATLQELGVVGELI